MSGAGLDLLALRGGIPAVTPRDRSCPRTNGCACLLIWCKACFHQSPADLQAIIAVGRGDQPLKDLKFPLRQVR